MGAIYATVQDLADRWRPLDSAEEARAVVLLEDAAVGIRAACPDVEARMDSGVLDRGVPKIVSCEMVKRAMLSPVDQPAAGQVQQTAGPFSQSISYTNPTGDLYLTKGERRLLGCGQQRASSVSMLPPGAGSLYPAISPEVWS